MDDGKQSLKIKALGFEIMATGQQALLTLLALAALVVSGLALGWWPSPMVWR